MIKNQLAKDIHILFHRPIPNIHNARNSNKMFMTMAYTEMLLLRYAEMDAIFQR